MKGPKSERKQILPHWFWPVLDKIIWPILGLLMRLAMFVAGIAILYIYVKKIKATYEVDKDRFEDHYGQPAFYPPWRLP